MLHWVSIILIQSGGGTYRNAIISRKPRYARHSLWSHKNHPLNKRTHETAVIFDIEKKKGRISYHISFRTYDTTTAMVTFLPLWPFDAWITCSPLGSWMALRTKRPRLTLRLERETKMSWPSSQRCNTPNKVPKAAQWLTVLSLINQNQSLLDFYSSINVRMLVVQQKLS